MAKSSSKITYPSDLIRNHDVDEEFSKYEKLFLKTKKEIEDLILSFNSKEASRDFKLAEKILVNFFKIESSPEYKNEGMDFLFFFRLLKAAYDLIKESWDLDVTTNLKGNFNGTSLSPVPLATRVQENSNNITLNIIQQELEQGKNGFSNRDYNEMDKNKFYERIIKNRQNRISSKKGVESYTGSNKIRNISIVPASKSPSTRNLLYGNKSSNYKGSRNISSNIDPKSSKSQNRNVTAKNISTVKFYEGELNSGISSGTMNINPSVLANHNIKELIQYSSNFNTLKKSRANSSSSSPQKKSSRNILIETQVVNKNIKKFIPKKNKLNS